MDISRSVLRDFSRRAFLKATTSGAVAAAATGALARKAFARSQASTAEKEQFLLDRITFGRNPQMVQEIQTRGYTGFLDWQLQLPGENPIDDTQLFEPASGSFPGGAAWQENAQASHPWGLTPYEILTDTAYPIVPGGLTYFYPGGKMWGHGPQLLMRGGWFGQHQLRWVLTDFFQNVHNTYILQPYQYLYWAPFLKNAIHAHSLGNYADMVKASGQGASMLWYLGQPDSDAANPNENYGRELPELHTTGPLAYTIGGTRYDPFVEADIPEIAKILTGWDMVGWHILDGTEALTPALGDFRYDAAAHAGGVKTVSNLGPAPTFGPKDYPGSLGAGQAEGEELILDLCAHPLTALHISRRLVQWFLGDDFQGTYYEPWVRTAVAFYLSGGDIKSTIRELFDETYFDQIRPPGSQYQKVRRPLNKVLAFLRGLDAHIDYGSAKNGRWYVQQAFMGQINGYWAAPNGYQPENEKWIGTLQPVVQFYYEAIWGGTSFTDPVSGLALDNGLRVDDALLGQVFPPGAVVADYAQLAADHLAGGRLTGEEIVDITRILVQTPLAGDKRRWALFFVLASPSYQFFC